MASLSSAGKAHLAVAATTHTNEEEEKDASLGRRNNT